MSKSNQENTARKFRVRIVGTSPYMQHKMDTDALKKWENDKGRVGEKRNGEKTEYYLALENAHICADTRADDKGQQIDFFFVPAIQIKLSLVSAGKELKSTASRKTLRQAVAGQIDIQRCSSLPEELEKKLPKPLHSYTHEQIPLPPFDVVDIRTAPNKKVGSRVVVYRPKWLSWGVTFELIVRNNSMTESVIRNLFEIAGQTVGIGSYRPEHTGQFGRFALSSLEFIGEDIQEVPEASNNHW